MKIKELDLYQLDNAKKTNLKKIVSIEEKIDANFLYVKIFHKNRIELYKKNKEKLQQRDFILNNGYFECYRFILESLSKNPNIDSLVKYYGHTLGFYYFHDETPLGVTYHIPTTPFFLISRCYNDTHEEIKLTNSILVEIFNDPSHFKVFSPLDKIDKDQNNFITKEKWNYDTLVKEYKEKLYANEPEGFILRNVKGKLFQIKNPYTKNIQQDKRRIPYEYVLKNFIKFIYDEESSRPIEELFKWNSYVLAVCTLFEEFIDYAIKNDILVEGFITPEDLENSSMKKYEMEFNLIPSIKTRSLCHESKLYEQVFKILLANLDKKKTTKNMVFLDKDDIMKWNSIVNLSKVYIKKERL